MLINIFKDLTIAIKSLNILVIRRYNPSTKVQLVFIDADKENYSHYYDLILIS